MSSGKDFVIEKYREHSCLWQVSHKDYHNKIKRNEALEELLQLFKSKDPAANKDTVLKKINSLRSSYRKEVNKIKQTQKSGAGSGSIHTPKLWFFDLLTFLGDQETPRLSSSISSILDSMPFGTDNEESDEEAGKEVEVRTSTPLFKKRKTAADKLLEKISNKMDEPSPSNERLPHQAFGEHIAERLRAMAPQMVPFTQRLVMDAIFLGEMCLINGSSHIETPISNECADD